MSQQGDDMYQGPQDGLELWAAGARTQTVHEAHTAPAELLGPVFWLFLVILCLLLVSVVSLSGRFAILCSIFPYFCSQFVVASEKAFAELMLSLSTKCSVSQIVKPNLPAHSDIKIEDGDMDIHKEVQVRLPSSTLQLFRHKNSYTDGGGCHARCQPAHQEQFGVQYLAEGHFDMHTRGIKPETFR